MEKAQGIAWIRPMGAADGESVPAVAAANLARGDIVLYVPAGNGGCQRGLRDSELNIGVVERLGGMAGIEPPVKVSFETVSALDYDGFKEYCEKKARAAEREAERVRGGIEECIGQMEDAESRFGELVQSYCAMLEEGGPEDENEREARWSDMQREMCAAWEDVDTACRKMGVRLRDYTRIQRERASAGGIAAERQEG